MNEQQTTKKCIKKDDQTLYENSVCQEVTEENLYFLRNNPTILKYAPNRPLDIKIGDYIVIFQVTEDANPVTYHVPKKVFNMYYSII